MGRHQRRKSRAQGMVEFALVGPMFFLILLGTIEAGRLMWTSHELSNGTREGARWASVRGERSGANITNGQVKDIILARTTALDSSLTVSLDYPDGNKEPESKVRISTTYNYVPMVGGFLGIGNITLSRQSELTIHY
jgi:Flp pilus assembly protein TadG